MRTLSYRVTLTPDDNDTVLVTCPDLPEVTTFGDDADDARLRAVDAIEEALAARIARREPIKAPTRGKGPLVTLPALTALKVELYRAALKDNVRKAELARRLSVHAPQVDRLFDLTHDSKLEQIESAFRALGRRIVVGIEKAA
ncbi:MAG: type II toxin-antitoxin system HicB family antitoxin [Alphaproteobacteria bacterium]|nr:type II toxin-antitoxin system HicB family antitoxin [Alphaproteobacteria bacterium]MCW5744299.1 type II toxin-antitoxin system HicB family antitoxin [Alphaproteobacteria bacterium]